MNTMRKLWQPTEWSQKTISPLGMCSLLVICVMMIYISSPTNTALGGWGEAGLAFAAGVVALGQGIPAVAAAGAAIAGGAAAATIIAPTIVVAGGAFLIGYGIAATVEAISEDREQAHPTASGSCSGSCSTG